MKTGLESLNIGAPKITYSGSEGPQSPQQMAEADPLLLEEYEKYVFEMEEQGLQPMSLEEFASEARAGMSDGGRIGFFRGALADTQGPAGGQAMSPGSGLHQEEVEIVVVEIVVHHRRHSHQQEVEIE
jgi:hypothetical protein